MQMWKRKYRVVVISAILAASLSGCAAIAVVDTAVTITSVAVKTTAKVAGAVVGTAVDGVRAVTRTKQKTNK